VRANTNPLPACAIAALVCMIALAVLALSAPSAQAQARSGAVDWANSGNIYGFEFAAGGWRLDPAAQPADPGVSQQTSFITAAAGLPIGCTVAEMSIQTPPGATQASISDGLEAQREGLLEAYRSTMANGYTLETPRYERRGDVFIMRLFSTSPGVRQSAMVRHNTTFVLVGGGSNSAVISLDCSASMDTPQVRAVMESLGMSVRFGPGLTTRAQGFVPPPPPVAAKPPASQEAALDWINPDASYGVRFAAMGWSILSQNLNPNIRLEIAPVGAQSPETKCAVLQLDFNTREWQTQDLANDSLRENALEVFNQGTMNEMVFEPIRYFNQGAVMIARGAGTARNPVNRLAGAELGMFIDADPALPGNRLVSIVCRVGRGESAAILDQARQFVDSLTILRAGGTL
jgi:hypothetical protein